MRSPVRALTVRLLHTRTKVHRPTLIRMAHMCRPALSDIEAGREVSMAEAQKRLGLK